ncbi:MAG: hypothetical protein JWN64_593 [Parcubacteria group bacterium]|nr:hypothetical protein [Parcubacteria group bacterium]
MEADHLAVDRSVGAGDQVDLVALEDVADGNLHPVQAALEGPRLIRSDPVLRSHTPGAEERLAQILSELDRRRVVEVTREPLACAQSEAHLRSVLADGLQLAQVFDEREGAVGALDQDLDGILLARNCHHGDQLVREVATLPAAVAILGEHLVHRAEVELDLRGFDTRSDLAAPLEEENHVLREMRPVALEIGATFRHRKLGHVVDGAGDAEHLRGDGFDPLDHVDPGRSLRAEQHDSCDEKRACANHADNDVPGSPLRTVHTLALLREQ